MGEPSTCQFGPFHLDLAAKVLFRGQEVVPLSPKAIETLVVLVQRRGSVVDKDELIRLVWPDTFIEEGGLARNISVLRKALGDELEEPQYIETVPKRGYRFVGPPAAPKSGGLSSLAVLPFHNAGGDPDAEYFSDGITETIINNLSQIGKLRVVARTTVFRYKGKDADAQTVGRDLNVRAVLTGKVHQRGDDLRIQAELISAQDGSQLWGQRYTKKAAAIFEIEEEIAKEISEALRLRLSGEEQRRLARRHTADNEAYLLYLKGRYYWNRRHEETLQQATECFRQAILRDRSYALAWAGLAGCYTLYGLYRLGSPREAFPMAREAALKALDLDRSLTEPHACLGVVKCYYEFDWAGGEKELLGAIELNPKDATAHNFFIMHLLPNRRFEDAIAHGKQSLEIEPLSLGTHVTLAAALTFAGRHDESIEVLRRAIELDPTIVLAHVAITLAMEAKGRRAEALEILQESARRFGRRPMILAALGRLYGMAGRTEEAKNVLEELKELSTGCYIPPFDFALVYIGLGQKEKAFEWLEKSLEDRSFWWIYCIRSALLTGICADSRFQNLLRRMNLAL